ncbi:MAG: NDP-sugar synthase [Phycisphaerae bacterium]|nr:NDP-sugar synthase [Phycisphaerae bacterium]
MQAIVLCGGKGTRLRDIAQDIPKPMVDVLGKPLLEHLVELLRDHAVNDVIMASGHLGDQIENYFGDGARFGLQIRHAREPKALGTAGALTQIPFDLADDFLLLYGDVYVDVDVTRMVEFHQAKGGLGTLLLHGSEHPYDSDIVKMNPETCDVEAFLGKPKPGQEFVNLTNAALYVLRRECLDYIPRDEPSDFGKDVFPRMIASGRKLVGYVSDEYLKDLGTVERYNRVLSDLQGMRNEGRGRISRS